MTVEYIASDGDDNLTAQAIVSVFEERNVTEESYVDVLSEELNVTVTEVLVLSQPSKRLMSNKLNCRKTLFR